MFQQTYFNVHSVLITPLSFKTICWHVILFGERKARSAAHCVTVGAIDRCVFWAVIWAAHKVVLSLLAVPRDKKKNVFHLRVSEKKKKKEPLKWRAAKGYILQSRWLWSGEIGRSYLFLTPLSHSGNEVSAELLWRWTWLVVGGFLPFCHCMSFTSPSFVFSLLPFMSWA